MWSLLPARAFTKTTITTQARKRNNLVANYATYLPFFPFFFPPAAMKQVKRKRECCSFEPIKRNYRTLLCKYYYRTNRFWADKPIYYILGSLGSLGCLLPFPRKNCIPSMCCVLESLAPVINIYGLKSQRELLCLLTKSSMDNRICRILKAVV